MPRPTIDFTIDTAADADGAALINALAQHRPDARFAIYVSGGELPSGVADSACESPDHERHVGHVYRWDAGVRLLGCEKERLTFVTAGGTWVELPLVGPRSFQDATGVRELILTLL
jgi:hypothetical protein